MREKTNLNKQNLIVEGGKIVKGDKVKDWVKLVENTAAKGDLSFVFDVYTTLKQLQEGIETKEVYNNLQERCKMLPSKYFVRVARLVNIYHERGNEFIHYHLAKK